jgi:hypothetical protein
MRDMARGAMISGGAPLLFGVPLEGDVPLSPEVERLVRRILRPPGAEELAQALSITKSQTLADRVGPREGYKRWLEDAGVARLARTFHEAGLGALLETHVRLLRVENAEVERLPVQLVALIPRERKAFEAILVARDFPRTAHVPLSIVSIASVKALYDFVAANPKSAWAQYFVRFPPEMHEDMRRLQGAQEKLPGLPPLNEETAEAIVQDAPIQNMAQCMYMAMGWDAAHGNKKAEEVGRRVHMHLTRTVPQGMARLRWNSVQVNYLAGGGNFQDQKAWLAVYAMSRFCDAFLITRCPDSILARFGWNVTSRESEDVHEVVNYFREKIASDVDPWGLWSGSR